MCRLYGFRSSVLSQVHHSLVAADNALALQSERHPDGWGVGFYVDRYPHLIKSAKKALADALFREISAVVATRTLLAHIRQATVGRNSVFNSHPFQHGPWCFAHNGEIAGFEKSAELRAQLFAEIDPRFRGYVFGQTDSEYAFYLFLSRLARKTEDIHHEGVTLNATLSALKETVDVLTNTTDRIIGEPSRLTFLFTNGSLLVGYRYRRELLFSTYKTRCPERASCPAYEAAKCEAEVKEGIVKHLIVTSEHIAPTPNVWKELQDGEFVAVDHGMRFTRGWLSQVDDAGGLRSVG